MNRSEKRGGGVSMLLSNGLDSKMLSDFCIVTPSYEVLTVKSRAQVFCVCYRPPASDFSLFFFSFLESFFEFMRTDTIWF